MSDRKGTDNFMIMSKQIEQGHNRKGKKILPLAPKRKDYNPNAHKGS